MKLLISWRRDTESGPFYGAFAAYPASDAARVMGCCCHRYIPEPIPLAHDKDSRQAQVVMMPWCPLHGTPEPHKLN